MSSNDTVTTVNADERSIELARNLAEARDNAKKWGEMADYYRDQLVEKSRELGVPDDEEKAVVASAGVKIFTITRSDRRIFDREKFERAHPEIDLDEYQKISSSTTVRVGRF